MSKPATPPSFATLVQAYFADYLTQQRALSPQTVAAYRDAFVLFLAFAQCRLGKSPTTMTTVMAIETRARIATCSVMLRRLAGLRKMPGRSNEKTASMATKPAKVP